MTAPRRAAPRPGARRWQWLLAIGLSAAMAAVILASLIALRPEAEWVLAPLNREPVVFPTPSPAPTIPEIARTQVWTSDTESSGEYKQNTLAIEPAVSNQRVVDFVVKVETTVPDVDPDDAAEIIQATFDDPRGWSGYGRTSFRSVTDVDDDTLVIYIAAPNTAQELCLPSDIELKWNCRVGNRVVLNSDRWLYMTPTYDDLDTYRNYLINHEVGHYLGEGHAACPAAGEKAPVMMQQSIDLGGCLPNAWPRESG